MQDAEIGKIDVIIVGTGPGGATAARELARGGKRVLLLERGADYRRRPYYGTYLGALRYADRRSLLFTEEGLNIIRPLMVGGATNMFAGCGALPPSWLKDTYGLDIDAEVAQTIAELAIKPLPPELRGQASTRIAQAAGALGKEWFPQPKFMKPARSDNFECGATCMLGCRCGAKWTAAEYVDQAVAAGAILTSGARVESVLAEGGQVTGVMGRLNGRPFRASAETVILAAGGIGTPRIMHASGFPDAGQGMAMDTTVMVYGVVDECGNGNEPPMTWSWENDDEGYMLSTLIDPWLNYPLIVGLKGPSYALTWPKWNHTLGIMIKLKDTVSGGVHPDGRISKPMAGDDQERLDSAEEVCRRILLEAGAKKESLFMTPLRGTHPSGTVRVGVMLDENLQSALNGLYVCDASVFPEALDRPTVLTIIGLSKRLANQLLTDSNEQKAGNESPKAERLPH
jgi:choline dehydrogenase-like flavoprotein